MNAQADKTRNIMASCSKIVVASLSVLVTLSLHGATIEFDIQPYANISAPTLDKSNLFPSGGIVFEVEYDIDDITGDLIARTISSTGAITQDDFDESGTLTTDNALWRASTTLAAQTGSISDSRRIVTSNPASFGSGLPFSWSAGLTDAMKATLDPGTDTEASTSPILDWIRGHSSNEGTGATNYRVRPHPLGPIVHSRPAYVGPPSEFFSDNDYLTFREANQNRAPMVYVGANDGMLHGFLAGNISPGDGFDDIGAGTEVFAYIPHSVLGGLRVLANKTYKQQYFVDGSPSVADAYGNFSTCGGACWRTILVGGLNSGGEAIFALDVTDPFADATSESNAADLVLWEFAATDTDDSEPNSVELGATYSQPIIEKLSDGNWVAIFGNGYNNASIDGKASLFIVNLASGALIQNIEVTPGTPGPTPNGLSSVTPWDANFDGNVDYIYTGDLEGNLWKFDLTNADSEGGATIAYGGNPLVTVSDTVTADTDKTLAITTAPIVTLHPTSTGTVIVYFGTGKLLETNDKSTEANDGIYAIFEDATIDDEAGLGENPDLTVHTTAVNADFFRGVTGTTTPENPRGWKIQLPTGERMINNMALSEQRLTFTTVDPLQAFNQNWLNAVDFLSGRAPTVPFFDVKAPDGIDAGDTITIVTNTETSVTVVPIGGGLGNGTVSGPTVATVEGGAIVLITRGEEGEQSFVSPFNDPGLPGGHFDEDNFFDAPRILDKNNTAGFLDFGKAPKCVMDELGWDYCVRNHTHEYDDKHNIDGVNMLVNGGSVVSPPDVLSATGILGQDNKAKDVHTSITGLAAYGDADSELGYTSSTEIVVQVINPHSVDTATWATERAARGLDDGERALPATVYWTCKNADGSDKFDYGTRVGGISAPDFQLLVASERTCSVNKISEFSVRYNDINALRATTPICAETNEVGPILPPSNLIDAGTPQNTSYRDGSIVFQAIANIGGTAKVIWENTNYEHLGSGVILPDGSKSKDAISCGEVNEHLRQYKDPTAFGAAEGTTGTDPATTDPDIPPVDAEAVLNVIAAEAANNSSGTVTFSPGTGRGTGEQDVTNVDLPDGRMSWREILSN
jgi:hypothetical protein